MASNEDRMASAVEQLVAALKKSSGPSLGLDSKPADFKKALTVSKDALIDFGKAASNSLNVFRDLSKTGAGFSNDIIGMSTAAAQSRMSLDEFSKVISENGKHMTGLGGSVGRGAEAFAKLSRDFFDSNLDRELRSMGYTSKELNEVLALTAGAQKSAFSEKAETDKIARVAAVAMAKEMDLIAKLTGKSRNEQMEEMTKRKTDGQAEAKLRQLTAGKGEEEAASIRNEYQKGLLEAQKQGTLQSYKEFFATGTYLSEEAATQAALFGKQARAQEESIKAMQGGDFVKAAEARERSAAESLKNQTNTTLLTIATLGSAAGTAGDIMVKNVEVNDALFHSIEVVKKEYETQNGIMISYGEALKLARDRIVQEQKGKDKEGKARSGATEGMIAIETAQQDFKAGLAGAAEAVDRDGKSLAGALRDTGTAAEKALEKIEGFADKGNLGKNIRERAEAGQRNEAPVIPPGTGRLSADEIKRDASGGVVGDATRLGSTAANKVVDSLAKAIGAGVGPNNPIGPMRTAPKPEETNDNKKQRSKGSLGETGKMFESFPTAGEDITVHGLEGVFTPEQIQDITEKAAGGAMSGVANKIKEATSQQESTTDSTAGFDIRTVFKDITTTFSSVTSLLQKKINAAELADAKNSGQTIKQDQLNKPIEAPADAKNSGQTIKQDQLNKPIEAPAAEEIQNPLLNNKGKISLNNTNLPGMPDFGSALAPKDPKGTDAPAAAIIEAAKNAEAVKTEAAKKVEAAKTEAAKNAEADNPPINTQQTANLNDVVKSLDQLNMQMGRLISQQSDLIRKQTTTMLSAGSNNVYDKTR